MIKLIKQIGKKIPIEKDEYFKIEEILFSKSDTLYFGIVLYDKNKDYLTSNYSNKLDLYTTQEVVCELGEHQGFNDKDEPIKIVKKYFETNAEVMFALYQWIKVFYFNFKKGQEKNELKTKHLKSISKQLESIDKKFEKTINEIKTQGKNTSLQDKEQFVNDMEVEALDKGE